MSTFLALAKVVFPPGACCLLPIALLASALLFGIVHLVGARQIGIARSNAEKRLIMTDNVWGGIVFGFLLWSNGLVAAMISHALLHAAWFPIEKSVYQRDVAGRADSGPSAGIARS